MTLVLCLLFMYNVGVTSVTMVINIVRTRRYGLGGRARHLHHNMGVNRFDMR